MAEWFGVLITAASVTFCYILTSSKSGNNPELLPALAGFILCFYSADHLRDLRHYRQIFTVPVNLKRAYIFLFIAGLVMVATGVRAVWAYPALWRHYWPAVVATHFYVLFRNSSGNGFAWLRTFLISFAVTAVILPGCCNPDQWLPLWSGAALALLLVCWINVLAYGYYDRKKDRLTGSKTVFSHLSDAGATRLFGVIIAVVGLAGWWLKPVAAPFSGGLIYAGIIAAQFSLRNVIPGWLHRWLPDLALPFVLYPFG